MFDDRKFHWIYIVPISILIFLLWALLDRSDGDVKVQSAFVVGMALVSLIACWIWARRLAVKTTSPAAYVKGTTTSRTMMWFWIVLVIAMNVAQTAGIGSQALLPLWESSLYTFAGMGSVLLTVGPAYTEYKEGMHTALD